PTQLFIRASFDGGKHWRAPLQVNDNQNDGEAPQPNITGAPNGRVAGGVYDPRPPRPARGTPAAPIPRLTFHPRAPFGRANYCVNTAIQFYTAALKPLGHNIRLSPQTWDPQLSSPHPDCICNNTTFLGDYFGVASRGGFTYTTSVETYNAAGENPGFHQ